MNYKECEFCIKGSQYVNGEYLCYAQTNSKKYHKEKFCKDNPNCYFKQNLALKEENEKLQKIRTLAMQMHDDWNRYDPINEGYIERIETNNQQLKEENEKLQRMLEFKEKDFKRAMDDWSESNAEINTLEDYIKDKNIEIDTLKEKLQLESERNKSFENVRQLLYNEIKKLSGTSIKFNSIDEIVAENTTLKEKLKIAVEAIKRFKYPCTDCRFYQECDRKGKCRTKTNFEFSKALNKIGEVE